MKSELNSPIEQVKDFIRKPFAWPGGYTRVLITNGGEMLCHKCAKSELKLIIRATKDNLRDGWQAAAVDIFWEGPAEHCAHCNDLIESSYGDPGA